MNLKSTQAFVQIYVQWCSNNVKLRYEKCLRYWGNAIGLPKGKYSIGVADESALISALETVKQAVDTGELDAQITMASEHARRAFEPRTPTK